MNPYAPLLASLEQLLDSLRAQLPQIASALVVVGSFVGLAALLRRLVTGGLGRIDRTVAQMLGQLSYAATVVLGTAGSHGAVGFNPRLLASGDRPPCAVATDG